MKTLLRCLLSTSLLVSPLIAQSEAPERLFNPDQVAGFVAQELDCYEGAVLDYELDRRNGGSMHFQHCPQVETTREEDILDSQYPLFKQLLVNCLALKRYAASTEAMRSFFPFRLRESDIAAFPATAMVRISEASMARSAKARPWPSMKIDWMSPSSPPMRRLLSPGMTSSSITSWRADFDEDGFEDLLLRIDWNARDAMGHGTDLILLSKKRATRRLP